MPLNKQVKAGSITHLTDARFFAAYDVAYIGFCFDPQSPDYISPQAALAIKGWINGPQIVAEFANQDVDNVINIIEFFQPDIAELDSQYSTNDIQQIAAVRYSGSTKIELATKAG
jgi:phosphoribosylanthranilate isomerase